MKKATGDLASTLVVALSVAILIAFFFYTIWPIMKNNFDSQTKCEKAICETEDANKDGLVDCLLCEDSNCTKNTIIECKFKG